VWTSGRTVATHTQLHVQVGRATPKRTQAAEPESRQTAYNDRCPSRTGKSRIPNSVPPRYFRPVQYIRDSRASPGEPRSIRVRQTARHGLLSGSDLPPAHISPDRSGPCRSAARGRRHPLAHVAQRRPLTLTPGRGGGPPHAATPARGASRHVCPGQHAYDPPV
jgi:hypothetical protein